MGEDGLDYQQMIGDALRGVVRNVLARVAAQGLPGEHHFFITFRVDDPEVVMPVALRQQYPEELRIVLQHRFQGLEVDENSFSVTLWFGGVAHRLTVPYLAITTFYDPSVPFGLQLPPPSPQEDDQGGAPEAVPGDAGDDKPTAGNVLSFEPNRNR